MEARTRQVEVPDNPNLSGIPHLCVCPSMEIPTMSLCYPRDSLYVQMMINLMRCHVLRLLIDFLIEN